MAHDYKGKAGGYCCIGYALARYQTEPGSDRDVDCGYCFAAPILCSPNREGVHSAAAGRGNCSCEAEWGAVWKEAHGTAKRAGPAESAMAAGRIVRKSSSQTAGGDA